MPQLFQVLVIKYGQLSAVTQGKLIQYGAQVVADGALREVERLRDFFVIKTAGDKLDDFIFPVADPEAFRTEIRGARHEVWELAADLTAKDALALHDRIEGRDDRFDILLDQVAPGAHAQGADDVFIVGEGGEVEDTSLRVFL